MNYNDTLTVGPNKPDNVKFGEILHNFRNNVRLSRSEVASRLELSSEYIRLIERGERPPPLGTAIKLLAAYELPFDVDIKRSRIIFETTSVEFTSRIKEARHNHQSRNEMIGEIVKLLLTADNDTLKEILDSDLRRVDAAIREHRSDGKCADHLP
jgi:transcriptional regulator with XRE-family HTH domain